MHSFRSRCNSKSQKKVVNTGVSDSRREVHIVGQVTNFFEASAKHLRENQDLKTKLTKCCLYKCSGLAGDVAHATIVACATSPAKPEHIIINFEFGRDHEDKLEKLRKSTIDKPGEIDEIEVDILASQIIQNQIAILDNHTKFQNNVGPVLNDFAALHTRRAYKRQKRSEKENAKKEISNIVYPAGDNRCKADEGEASQHYP